MVDESWIQCRESELDLTSFSVIMLQFHRSKPKLLFWPKSNEECMTSLSGMLMLPRPPRFLFPAPPPLVGGDGDRVPLPGDTFGTPLASMWKRASFLRVVGCRCVVA